MFCIFLIKRVIINLKEVRNMDLTMDIAAMSVNMNTMQTMQAMDISVMKMAMTAEAAAMENMLEAIDVSSLTGVGSNLDIIA